MGQGNGKDKAKSKPKSTGTPTKSPSSNNVKTSPRGNKSESESNSDSDVPESPTSKAKSTSTKRDSQKKGMTSSKKDSDSQFNAKKLDKLFETYKEVDPDKPANEEDYIGPTGVTTFLGDLGVDPEDVVVLVLAWHLKAVEMGYFTKKEFTEGFKALNCDTIDKIKAKFDGFRTELNDPAKLKEIYKYSFHFVKEDADKKTIPIDMAEAMLKLVLGKRSHVGTFCQFLTTQTEYKGINLDQWMSFLEFSRAIGPKLEEYDEAGAWPVLIDLYVEWHKEHASADGAGKAKASED